MVTGMGGTHAGDRGQLPPISVPVPLFGLPVRPLPASRLQVPAAATAQSSIQWGTHPLSSPPSVLVGVLLFVFDIFSQGSVVPQDVRGLCDPPASGSWSGAVRHAHLSQSAAHGARVPPRDLHRRYIPSVRSPRRHFRARVLQLGPAQCPQVGSGKNGGPYARSADSREGAHRGGAPPRPPIPSNRIGPRDPQSGLAPLVGALPHLDRPLRFCRSRLLSTRPRLPARGGAASLPPLQSSRPPMRGPANPGRPPRSRHGRLRHVRPRLPARGGAARLSPLRGK
ncbi:hypothetical protein NDU88_002558 [Pleurodeles waltl]|uniref:Uncharacterized protein n=1 Tax=Pleurodeles waltl TaxID=8319 RepID=A0AAV7Q7G4_PLEWA|nr:hypothetical protein NDU88_002558 [Pleurodeles waltl]